MPRRPLPEMPATATPRDPHQLEASEVVELLGCDPAQGLSSEEVHRRLHQFGPNELARHRPVSELRRFLMQFVQPLVYILVIATIITALLGEWVDASVIFGIVLVNAIVGFIQEGKAEKAIEETITAANCR